MKYSLKYSLKYLQNKEEMPIGALMITNLIIQIFLLSFLVTDLAYTLMASLVSSTILLSYACIASYQMYSDHKKNCRFH